MPARLQISPGSGRGRGVGGWAPLIQSEAEGETGVGTARFLPGRRAGGGFTWLPPWGSWHDAVVTERAALVPPWQTALFEAENEITWGVAKGVAARRWHASSDRSQLPLRVLRPGGARPGPTDAAAETGAERSPLATSARAGRRDQGVGSTWLPHRWARRGLPCRLGRPAQNPGARSAAGFSWPAVPTSPARSAGACRCERLTKLYLSCRMGSFRVQCSVEYFAFFQEESGQKV